MGLMEYINDGGVVMKILIAMNTVGIALIITKWIQYMLFIKQKKVHTDEIICEFFPIASKDTKTVLPIVKELLGSRLRRLEKGMPTIKIIAATATLFGLLGTVVGILMAFEAIGKTGMGDPSIFAKGISMALVTTVGGLIVAIIHTVGYNYLTAFLDDIESQLQEELLTRLYGSSA